MNRLPPNLTLTYSLFPYPTLFRSQHQPCARRNRDGRRRSQLGDLAPARFQGCSENQGKWWLGRVSVRLAERCERGERVEHADRSEEHTSELPSLMRISYAVFCLNKKNTNTTVEDHHINLDTT